MAQTLTANEEVADHPHDADIRDPSRRPSTLWLVALTVALTTLGATSAYLFSQRQPDVYAAKVRIWVHSPEAQSDATTTLQTHREIAVSPAVLGPVAQLTGLNLGAVERAISIDIPRASRILAITAEQHDPQSAHRLALAVVRSYINTITTHAAKPKVRARRELQSEITRLAFRLRSRGESPESSALREQIAAIRRTLLDLEIELATQTQLDIITPVHVLDDPVKPRPLRAAAGGGLAGSLIALTLAAVLRRVRSR